MKKNLFSFGGIVIASFFFFISGLSYSQDWQVYNTDNSELPLNLVPSIACDSSGVIWIGTGGVMGNGGGLARLCGNNWEVFTMENSELPSDAIWALLPDYKNGIWVGTAGGLSGSGEGLAHFDGENWTIYDSGSSNLPSNSISALKFGPSMDLWVGTNNGLARFDGNDFEVFRSDNSGLPNNRVMSIAFDTLDNLWVGLYEGGLASYDGESWTVLKSNNSGLPSNKVSSIAFDSQNRLWIGTAVYVSGPFGKGLSMYDGENWETWDKDNSELPHNDVFTVVVDSSDNVWLACGDHLPINDGGLVKFDYDDGENMEIFTPANSNIPFYFPYSIAIDKFGNKWVGSVNPDEQGGIAVFNEDDIVIECTATAIEENIISMPFSDGFLHQNFPNPVIDITLISYDLLNQGEVHLGIYDNTGKLVEELVSEQKKAGHYQIYWNRRNLPGGVYFYTLIVNGKPDTKRMILIR